MPIPERLGKYLIRGELGRGAMGIVYEGFDPLIERTVAIKVLQIELANAALAAELRHRFRREAQAAGRLSHPNIVPVYDYGEAAELSSAFIAMELIRGRDLKRLFDDGVRFTLQDTGRIMGELLGALQHAHERGVIHRDIKPGNIMLLDDGTVKVTDFGIAKIDASELTQVGSVLGTVTHMSPEQLSGDPVDRRSDLFSCGVILYQLLTGERPFSGSPATVMHKVLHEDPPAPSLRTTGLPPGIDSVVRQAMAKSPAQRYATAAAFAGALHAALGADPDATVVAPGARARPAATRFTIGGGLALAAFAAIATIAAAGIAAWRWLPRGDAPPETQAVVPLAIPQPASAVAPVPAPLPEPPQPVVAAPSDDEIDQSAWGDAAKANTVGAYEAYLKSYPKGRFASRARVRIAALQPRPAPAVVAAPTPAPAPAPAAVAPDKTTVAVAPPRLPETRPAALPPRPEPSPASAPQVTSAARHASPAASTGERAVARGEPECAEEARRGNARCQVALGLLYRHGKGVPQNPAEAVGWFRKAADQGYAAGQYEFGAMLSMGLGVRADPAEALRWFRRAAEQGEARSQNRLGQAHESGDGATRSLVLAADWYRKAADQGLAVAQTNLGRLYLHGRGVFKDTTRAADLLQKAADQGEANARFHLGWMFEKGDGKIRDRQQAAVLYRQALGSPSLGERNRQEATAFLASNPAL